MIISGGVVLLRDRAAWSESYLLASSGKDYNCDHPYFKCMNDEEECGRIRWPFLKLDTDEIVKQRAQLI